jgi:hypothetical protein
MEWLQNQRKPAEDVIFEQDESLGENYVEHKLVKGNQGEQINQLVSEHQYEKEQDDDFDDGNIEVRLGFTSRLYRDSFIMALRVITTMRSIALAPLVDNSELVFRK